LNASIAGKSVISRYTTVTINDLAMKISQTWLLFAASATPTSMTKDEREWVAMLLAELHFLGFPEMCDHYLKVLNRMDYMVGKEFRQCMIAFRREGEIPDESE